MTMSRAFVLAGFALAGAAIGPVATAPVQAAPAFQLGTPNFSDAYCARLAQRCEQGDIRACTLYVRSCDV